MKKVYKKSKRKIDMTEWNGFSPEVINTIEGKYKIEYVDIDRKYLLYYENCSDTAVFKIKFKNIADAINFCMEVKYADEMNAIPLSETEFIFRLWWD